VLAGRPLMAAAAARDQAAPVGARRRVREARGECEGAAAGHSGVLL
jgi:hypothetical protein